MLNKLLGRNNGEYIGLVLVVIWGGLILWSYLLIP